MTTYSFRAEHPEDVKAFVAACMHSDIVVDVLSIPFPGAAPKPDMAVEIQTDATLFALQAIMQTVDDRGMMMQTLRACSMSQNAFVQESDTA